MVTLYHDSHIEVFHTPAQRKLVLLWIGTQTESSIKETGKKLLELVQEHGILVILNDNLHVQGSWEGATEWTRTYWFNEIKKHGVRYFAWVLSFDSTARETALSAMPGDTMIKAFASRHEADVWLDLQSQRKLSGQYRRDQAKVQHTKRKDRCLLTLKQAIGGERSLNEILEKLQVENPSVLQIFKQFNVKTSAEKFLIILNVMVNRYTMSSDDVLALLTVYFSGSSSATGSTGQAQASMEMRQLNRLIRLIMRPLEPVGTEEYFGRRNRWDWLDD